MSVLHQAKKPVATTKIITVCGTPGTGKTSLACTFPQPAFLIQTQGEGIPDDVPENARPVSLGITDSYKKLLQQLRALINDEHDFKTVIIDSVTGLEGIFVREVEAESEGKPIQKAAGGYGAGRQIVLSRHNKLREAAEKLREKGIYVLFIAHSDIITVSPPDSDPYSVYSLRLHKESLAPYVDNVDVVGFVKQEVVLIGDDDKRKRAISSGDRVFACTLQASAVAKNRLGITEDIPIKHGQNPLAPWLGLGGDKSPVHNNVAKDDGVEFNEEEGN